MDLWNHVCKTYWTGVLQIEYSVFNFIEAKGIFLTRKTEKVIGIYRNFYILYLVKEKGLKIYKERIIFCQPVLKGAGQGTWIS